MPEVHAILSASSSKRWLNCTPSARLEQNFPNESSVYAEEGTAAHALGEYKLRKYLHERVKRPTSEYEDEEMKEWGRITNGPDRKLTPAGWWRMRHRRLPVTFWQKQWLGWKAMA